MKLFTLTCLRLSQIQGDILDLTCAGACFALARLRMTSWLVLSKDTPHLDQQTTRTPTLNQHARRMIRASLHLPTSTLCPNENHHAVFTPPLRLAA